MPTGTNSRVKEHVVTTRLGFETLLEHSIEMGYDNLVQAGMAKLIYEASPIIKLIHFASYH